MIFSSTIFLFLFLPVVLLIHYATPRKGRNLVLILASLVFYFWGETFFVGVMLVSILANHAFGLLVDRAESRRAARRIVGLAVAVNLGLLVACKYTSFLTENLNVLLAALGLEAIERAGTDRLPLGISFFTFQALSYVIDVYRGQSRARRGPLNLALYISMFPQLIAGPIVRYHQIEEQLAKRRVTLEHLGRGVQRFVIGLGKKVLLATPLQAPVDAIFDLPVSELSPAIAWLGAACYMLQLYFDFSGYSDMAVGLGHMLGFRLPENFNYPFVARSVRGIWRRWHITLMTWFRDYLYIPMGGSRAGRARTYLNLITVFVLVGLWHGARWNFVVFGLYHGVFLILERFEPLGFLRRTWRPLQHVYLLAVWLFGLAIFRSNDLPQAGAFLAAMLGAGGESLRSAVEFLTREVVFTALVAVPACLPLLDFVRGRIDAARRSVRPRARTALDAATAAIGVAAISTILALSAIHLAASTQQPFIYFRF